jgi:centriolar protein POC1
MHKIVQHYPNAHGPGHSPVTQARPPAVNSVEFGGPGGEWLISTGTDGLVKVWDLMEGHLLYTLHGHKESMATNTACFSPGNEYFASGGDDAQVFLWKSNLKSSIQEIKLPRERT